MVGTDSVGFFVVCFLYIIAIPTHGKIGSSYRLGGKITKMTLFTRLFSYWVAPWVELTLLAFGFTCLTNQILMFIGFKLVTSPPNWIVANTLLKPRV